MFKLAWKVAGKYRTSLILLTAYGVTVALIEALTLVLLFSFVSSLMGTVSGGNNTRHIGIVSELLKDFSLTRQAAIVFLLATLKFVLTLSIEWKTSKLWVQMRSMLQQRMLAVHINTNLSYILSKKLGEHVNHIIECPSHAAVFYLHLVRFFSTGIMLAVLLGTLLVISVNLMLSAIALIIFYGFAVKRLSNTLSYEMGNKQSSAIKKQTALASEGIAGIRYLQMLGGIKMWVNLFNTATNEAEYAMQRGGFWNSVPSRTIEYLVLVFFLGIVVISLLQKNNVALDIPTLAVYFLAIVRILPSLSILGNGRMQMMQSFPYLEQYRRLETLIGSKIINNTTDQPKLYENPVIKFKNVSFSYPQQKNVLSKINFEIPSGAIVGLIGRSGQGKSTILDLLVGFLPPSDGQIYFGANTLHQMDLNFLRRQFSYVGQDVFLFHDTLRENIKLANPSATDNEVAKVCELTGINNFMQEFPLGLDTVLADRGQSVSGGQRQRISIARALLSPAKILLLDEPTSALDARSEKEIISHIIKEKGDKTVVLITHKLELLKFTDMILVVNSGGVQSVQKPEEAIAICDINES